MGQVPPLAGADSEPSLLGHQVQLVPLGCRPRVIYLTNNSTQRRHYFLTPLPALAPPLVYLRRSVPLLSGQQLSVLIQGPEHRITPRSHVLPTQTAIPIFLFPRERILIPPLFFLDSVGVGRWNLGFDFDKTVDLDLLKTQRKSTLRPNPKLKPLLVFLALLNSPSIE